MIQGGPSQSQGSLGERDRRARVRAGAGMVLCTWRRQMNQGIQAPLEYEKLEG